jgi:hypothetical protein|tara:strand:+ start:54 stop:698 length:645 start_codon:yes stop_codon:yes gene_type:complete
MGRPLNKKFFGAPTAGGSEIKVQFHNGTKSVNGYIVKQLGSKKFRCTDGVATTDCFLVDKAAGAIAAGEMSIVVKDDAGAVKQVTKISGKKVTLDTGTTISWNFSTATDDAAVQMEEAGDASEVAATVINAITAADPGAVTTTANHLLVNGDRVRITGVVGMTELNGNVYTVTKTGATTFTIGVDTSDTDDYTAYTSDGVVTQVEAGADVFEAN